MWISSALLVVAGWLLCITRPSIGQKLDDVMRPRDVEACSASTRPRILTEYSGWFSTQNYPAEYPNSANCQWLIKSHSNTVSVDFLDFNLETSYDRVTFYDGETTSDPVIATFTGPINPPPTDVHSRGHLMLVIFTSDTSVTRTGFNATYTSSDFEYPPDPCNPLSRPVTITDYSGTFQSGGYPNPYQNYADCQWKFVSQETNGIVQLTFNTFRTERDYDFVRIYDGDSVSAPLINILHGILTTPVVVRSTQQNLFMRFTSDSTYTETGFSGTFTSLPPQTTGPTASPPTTPTTPRPFGPCGRFLEQSPSNTVIPEPYDLMCHLNQSDADHLYDQCYDLLQDLPDIGSAESLLLQGGNFGCYLTSSNNFDNAANACFDNYQWRSVLANCGSCTRMFVCIRYS